MPPEYLEALVIQGFNKKNVEFVFYILLIQMNNKKSTPKINT